MVFATPGNPGIAEIATCIPAGAGTPEDYLAIANSVDAALTVVGPEAPLVTGVVDLFRAAGRPIVGPTQAAARLEGSKAFSKGIMTRAGVPTARFTVVEDEASALAALADFELPVVLKADGLAAGKGVIINNDRDEAAANVRAFTAGSLVGDAGRRLVIEEFLEGEEVSFMCLTDGKRVVALPPSQDHKRIFDGDEGLNTGGMGAYCDTRLLTAEQSAFVIDRVIRPTLAQMEAEGCPFTGFLYAGLMLTSRGIQVLEFNVRMGDPETQAIFPRISTDVVDVLADCANGRLSDAALALNQTPAVCLVLAAAGYPGKPRTGDPISGLKKAQSLGAMVFHAGTKLNADGVLATAGGRVLGVTATGETLQAAIDNVYRCAAPIQFDGMQFRTDIGKRGLNRWPKAVAAG